MDNRNAWRRSGLASKAESTTLATLARALVDLVLRGILTFVEKARRCVRLLSRPELFGAHAIPITPEGKIVLIKLRYVPDWRLPGGGIEQGETSRDAALRELREEIGLLAHSSIELIREGPEQNSFRTGRESVFLVKGVTYQPKWSLEVEVVEEFRFDRLPPDLSPWTRRALAGRGEQNSSKDGSEAVPDARRD